MNRKGKIYIFLTAFAIISIVALEYSKPAKLNWFPTYAQHHKIPFGTYVFHEQMERIFSKEKINKINVPPFEYLYNNPEINGTYVFINNQVSFGEAELDRILEWTANGNTLFVASSNFEEQLLDTLNLSTETINTFNNFNQDFSVKLKNERLDNSIFNFDKANFLYHFDEIDTLNTKVIGVADNIVTKTDILDVEHINIIKQEFGNGSILLSTFPQAFTNYFMLKSSNHKYASGLMSYLNNDEIIYLDQHYKSGKSYYTSPLYILLNTKELKWAYYILLIGAFFYVIFEGKRKQRAIPVVKPLRNKSVDFTRTIANMYYEKGKHKEISKHKIQHFLDHIRTHLHLNTNVIDSDFIKQLAARSNNTIEDTEKLFKTIEKVQNKTTEQQEELEALNALIEKFKSKNTWKIKT